MDLTILAMILAGAMAWEAFRQWSFWSSPKQDGWQRVKPSPLQYLHLGWAAVVLLLCIFAFSVVPTPMYSRDYWVQRSMVVILGIFCAFMFAKLRGLANKRLEWCDGRLRFNNSSGTTMRYRFDEIESVSGIRNWRIKFADGNVITIDGYCQGARQLVDQIEAVQHLREPPQ